MLATRLAALAGEGEGRGGGLLISEIDGRAAEEHPLAVFLRDAGFVTTAMGMQLPRGLATVPSAPTSRTPSRRRLTSSPWSLVTPVGKDDDPDA